jgi:hypothetical protein
MNPVAHGHQGKMDGTSTLRIPLREKDRWSFSHQQLSGWNIRVKLGARSTPHLIKRAFFVGALKLPASAAYALEVQMYRQMAART